MKTFLMALTLLLTFMVGSGVGPAFGTGILTPLHGTYYQKIDKADGGGKVLCAWAYLGDGGGISCNWSNRRR